ncbi:hypothetical protein [Neobacillus kokaensis]|uniref:Spore germination protein n=1 Tax=Neobacillus kokaensis TaxID=2759023 RepID=A0ABQ3MYK0_9BACI|nr:hypothetical protein [Neobacillus kokaensis]GHH97748.1 hypothetical protein AM1BK_12910 [Neobacillus kokaensis]
MATPILSPTFHIGTIKIGTIESASCFSIGNNFIEDFKSSKKTNQGLGNIHGSHNDFSSMSAGLTNYEDEKKNESEKPPE